MIAANLCDLCNLDEKWDIQWDIPDRFARFKGAERRVGE